MAVVRCLTTTLWLCCTLYRKFLRLLTIVGPISNISVRYIKVIFCIFRLPGTTSIVLHCIASSSVYALCSLAWYLAAFLIVPAVTSIGRDLRPVCVIHMRYTTLLIETIPHVRLESWGGVLSTVDMVVQRRDGPRRLRDHDDDDTTRRPASGKMAPAVIGPRQFCFCRGHPPTNCVINRYVLRLVRRWIPCEIHAACSVVLWTERKRKWT